MTDKATLEQYYRQLRESFPFFLKEVWRFNHLPEPSRVQYDIADWLQNGPKRLIVRGFRGLAKTWITSAFVVWRLFKEHGTQITLSSASEGLSVDSLHMIREWLDLIPFLQPLAPAGHDRRDAAKKFDVAPAPRGDRTPSIRAIGITGALPGGRSHLIIADDVETPENTLTREQRQRQRTRIEGYEHLLYPGGAICFLGSPQHEESTYDYLVEELGYQCRSYPIRYPSPDEKVPDLSPMLRRDLDEGRAKPGDPIWPQRFGRDVILEKQTHGKTTFLMQYMLVSDLGDIHRYPLKLSDFIVFDVHPTRAPGTLAWGQSGHAGSTAIEDIPSVGFGDDQFYAPIMVAEKWHPYQGIKAFIDPAGGGKSRNLDELAWSIVGQLHGYLYVKHVDGLKGGATSENVERIVLSLREHRATELYIETNFGGEMLIQLIEPVIRRFMLSPGEDDAYPDGWVCAVYPYHAAGQKEKEVRIIDTLEPVMNQHRLVISRAVASDRVLMHQLTRIIRERNCLEHDDRVDSLAADVMAKRREEQEREDMYDLYRQHFARTSGSIINY